jgi:hypothetical protein
MKYRGATPTKDQRDQVEAMASFGLSPADIGRCLGLTEAALRKSFADELDRGSAQMIALIAGNLFRVATAWPPIPGATVSAAIFWLKARAGWRTTGVAGADSAATGKKVLAQAEAERVAGDAAGEWSGLLTADPASKLPS